jgi:hypothetical protein
MRLALRNNTEIEIMDCDLPEAYTWDEAVNLCSVKGNNWRLPTVSEIKEIYNRNVEYKFAEGGYWGYWTCEETSKEGAILLSGPDGRILNDNKKSKFFVRMVKSQQND